MKKFSFYLSILSILLISCNKTEDSVKETSQDFFEITIKNILGQNQYPGYLILNNENGDVITYKEFADNSSVRFDSLDPEGLYTIQLVLFFKSTGNEHVYRTTNVNVYNNIKPSNLTFGEEAYSYSLMGLETVEISGLTYDHNIKGQNIYTSGYRSNQNTLKFDQYINPDFLYLSYWLTGVTPKYAFINNVELNANIKIDTSSFKPLNKNISIGLNGVFKGNLWVSATLSGLSNSIAIVNKEFTQANVVDFPFPNEPFTKYSTFLNISNDSYRGNYLLNSNLLPSSAKILDANAESDYSSNNELSCTVTGNADYMTFYFMNSIQTTTENTNTYIFFHTSFENQSNKKLPVIPDEINQLLDNAFNEPLEFFGVTINDNSVLNGPSDWEHSFSIKMTDTFERRTRNLYYASLKKEGNIFPFQFNDRNASAIVPFSLSK